MEAFRKDEHPSVFISQDVSYPDLSQPMRVFHKLSKSPMDCAHPW